MTLPVAEVNHRMPGRTRLRIRAKRGDGAYFAELERQLGGWPGIRGVQINPQTAGVLLLHDSSLEDIGRHAEGRGLFRLVTSDDPGPSALALAAGGVEAVNRQLAAMSGGAIDLSVLVFLVLVGMGIYQIRQGKILAPAVTLLWSALQMLPLGRRP